MNKIILSVAFLFYISACAAVQGPLKRGEGYVVLPISENEFRIEYYSISKKYAEDYWNITAAQLCPDGIYYSYSKDRTVHSDMYVPISGNNVNIGKQTFIHYGFVTCNGLASSELPMTKSQWAEFNLEVNKITPVSDRWLTQTLKLEPNYLIKLPAENTITEFTKRWRKPLQKIHINNETLATWTMGGNSWFPNQVGIIERDNCLTLILIIPPETTFMMKTMEESLIQSGSTESLISSRILSAYFYRPYKNCFSKTKEV